MDDVQEDSWVRQFDVSNPQKTHAGYTVYRVSSKVYPKGSPEAASQIIVFKRYSEIRKLYKELKVIYESKDEQRRKFPHLSKANFFNRFDEAVVEERQRQALMLLNFAGNISFLFTSQPFVKFFEGGVAHAGQGSSRGSSDSDHQYVLEELTEEDSVELEPWAPQTYFNADVNSSDEETFESNKDPSDPNVFLDFKNVSVTDDSTPMDSSKKTWLARAISLCSEGDDIETLASEAGQSGNEFREMGENCTETSDDCEPQGKGRHSSQPSQGSIDLLPTLLESSEGEEDTTDDVDVFVDIVSAESSKENVTPDVSPQASQDPGTEREVQGDHTHTKISSVEKFDVNNDLKYSEQYDNKNQQAQSQDRTNGMTEDERTKEETGTSKKNEVTDSERKGEVIEKRKKGHQQVGRQISNIGVSWIDPKKKDYLYEAAQIIQQALYCEANELYEDAFNKYKMCVGILLKGVQHDSNSKRREAVRRKTAQYLVKAEFLFNTYLKPDQDDNKNDWTVKSSNASEDNLNQSVADRRFHQLTLRSLKVFGVIKKVMLVECHGVDGVFVVKVLHKTNAVHRSAKQESKQTNKGLSKKYVNSSHMVKLHRHFDTSNSIFLILEYAPGGSLWNHISNLRQPQVVTEEESREILRDVTSSKEGMTAQTEQHNELNRRESDAQQTEKSDCRQNYSVPMDDPCNSGTGFLTSSDELGQTNAKSTNTQESDRLDVSKSITDTGEVHETCETAKYDLLFDDQTDLKPESSAKRELNCEENYFEQITSSHNALGYLDHVTQGEQTLGEEYVQQWIAELLLAMTSVHSCGIIFKDLKPANILLDDNGSIVLSYFGVWEEVDHSVDPEAVEHLYCAPEISCGDKVTIAADWWSFGVLSYELLTGKTLSSSHPWGIHPHSSINFPAENISAEARSLLEGLICHNPSERLGSGINGVEEIKSHAFFKEVNWDELSKHS